MIKPNILMIVADQFRHDCIGRAGLLPVKTPHLDRLAKEGVRFEHAYTSTPSCCPARQSMMTGRSAESLGALWNYDGALPVASITPEVFTWTHALREAGYTLGFIGKWHVSKNHDPTEFGFRDYYPLADFAKKTKDIGRAPKGAAKWFGADDPTPIEETRTHLLAEKTAGLISDYSLGDTPWHLRLDLTEPHLPCHPAGRFAGMYQPETVPKWGSFGDSFEGKPYIQSQQLRSWGLESKTWDDWSPAVARYFGVISQVDDAVGIVLNALEESGASDNTIVVFTADHGDLCGSHRMIDKHYVMYDDVVRVPLIVRWPQAGVHDAAVSEFVSNCLDIGPTLLDCAGLESGVSMHGRSFAGALRSGSLPDNWPDYIVSTYNGAQFGLYCQRMIRTPHWKYIWNPTDVDELYNLSNDPHELTNLAGVNRDIVHNLSQKLYSRLMEMEDKLVQNEWTRRQLLENAKA